MSCIVYIHYVLFEWDLAKAQSNLEKHDVPFDLAARAFFDLHGLDGADASHSRHECRSLRIAKSGGMLLTIAYTVRFQSNGTQKIRIISARRAGSKERRRYKEAGEDSTT